MVPPPRPNRRVQRFPRLLGQPSPSLAKIRKMTPQELETHVRNLAEEIGFIQRRIERLKTQRPMPAEHIDQLQEHIERLSTLQAKAQQRRELIGGMGYR